jgi:hypothetical protein
MAHLAGILLLFYTSTAVPAQSIIIAPGETAVCAHEDEPFHCFFYYFFFFFPSFFAACTDYYAVRRRKMHPARVLALIVRAAHIFRGGPPVTDGEYRRNV